MKNFFYLSTVLALATSLSSCSPTATGFSLPTEEVGFTGGVILNKKVDILFVVDNSTSMEGHQRSIAAQLPVMVEALNKLGMDYRFAVTTTSMSSSQVNACARDSRKLMGSPAYLTAENISQLPDRFVVGRNGCTRSAGLDAMALVTSPSYLTSINSDFMRNDALLVVNFITDSDDASLEFGGEFGEPDKDSEVFVKMLNARKPAFEDGSRAWIANFVGIMTTNENCDPNGGQVFVGRRYFKLVDASQGVKSSLCDLNLARSVSNIKARIVDHLKSYRFKEEPNKETIQVLIAGKAIQESAENGWILETETRADGGAQWILKFHGEAIPGADQPVNVTYKPKNAT